MSVFSWNFLISDDPSLTSVSVMSTSGGSGISDGFSGSADSESADEGASWVNSGPCCNMEVIFLWFVSITRSFFLRGHRQIWRKASDFSKNQNRK